MRAVTFSRSGQVVTRELEAAPPGPGEVSIAVEYGAINPTDVHHLTRTKTAPEESARIPGVEVAGVVTAVGGGVARWSPGDRVFGLVDHGGLASSVNAHESTVVSIPDALDELAASATPEAYVTAHDAILQARLTAGETMLVTGASGGVGLAAVQIGLAKGARVLGVSRSEAGQALLREFGAEAHGDQGLSGSELTIPYRDAVDVVIELVGALNMPANLAALRNQGRIVVIAAEGDDRIEIGLKAFKAKRGTLIGSTLRSRPLALKAEAIAAFEAEVLGMLASGAVKPNISRVFPAAEAAEAFAFMSTGGKLGKVLVDLR